MTNTALPLANTTKHRCAYVVLVIIMD